MKLSVTTLSTFLSIACWTTAAPVKAEEKQPEEGAIFQDCPLCPSMIVIPTGSFVMGSPDDEPLRNKNEGPQRTVSLKKPIAVGRFEVTFDEWHACLKDGGCKGYEPKDQGWGRGRRPVINVNWEHAFSYIVWLRKKTGKPYRLLSEAEWEYAARAGSKTAFWWGAKASHDYANFGKDPCCGGHVEGADKWKETAPVGQLPANPFGLHDMHGNVAEWVEDCGHNNYEGAPTDGSPWRGEGNGNCKFRIFRGGSWGEQPKFLRSAARSGSFIKVKNRNYGFRVARDLD